MACCCNQTCCTPGAINIVYSGGFCSTSSNNWNGTWGAGANCTWVQTATLGGSPHRLNFQATVGASSTTYSVNLEADFGSGFTIIGTWGGTISGNCQGGSIPYLGQVFPCPNPPATITVNIVP